MPIELHRPGALPNPTRITYNGFTAAYDFFNRELFENRLPHCLITLQRRARTYGYFSYKRFGDRQQQEVTDEIALNPVPFKTMNTETILATLSHEMLHLEQHHFGNPGRRGYHNREFADRSEALGLMPSNTGEFGGRRTGQRMHHYVIPGGAFAQTAAAFIADGGDVRYIDLWDEGLRQKKAESHTKYVCPLCAAFWRAKPNSYGLCGPCIAEHLGSEIADKLEPFRLIAEVAKPAEV
jgi:hypothetical protein